MRNSSIAVALMLVGCAGGPSVAPIDNALLANVPSHARATVDQARAARDAANDAYALSQSATEKAQGQVDVADASLKTIRSQLDESKLATELAGKHGSTSELEQAQNRHMIALAKADYGRGLLALRKRELEVATLYEQLALEEHRLSVAGVELAKAEALQEVDLIAAQQIPIKDYRRQVAYHKEEAATARARASAAEARLEEARGNLADEKRQLDALTDR